MSYVKLPKHVTDAPLGYQTINQANENGDALRAIYAVNHGLGEGQDGEWGKAGNHNDPSIPKTICNLKYALSFFETYTLMATGAAVKSISHAGTGHVEVRVGGLVNVRAVATPYLTTSVFLPMAKVIKQAAGTLRTGPGYSEVLHVYLFKRSGVTSEFEPANMSFSLAIYGDPN